MVDNTLLTDFEQDVAQMRAELQEKMRLRQLQSQEHRAERQASLDAELTPAVTALETALTSFGNWRAELHAAVAKVRELAAQHARLRRAVDAAAAAVSATSAAHYDAFDGSAALSRHLSAALAEVASNTGTMLNLDAATKEYLHIGGANQNGWEGLANDIRRSAQDNATGAAVRAGRRDWR